MLDSLAETHRSDGKLDRAESLLRSSLAVREKALGTEHPDVAASLNNLGVFYYGRHQYAMAEPLFQRALVIWEKAFGAEHQNVARGLRHLAEVYGAQDRYRQAVASYQRVVSIQEKSAGIDNPELAATLKSWALLLRKTNRKGEAEKLEERARVVGGNKTPGQRSAK